MEYISVLSICIISTVTCVAGKNCLKNDDIGWREGNIYECNDADYPECCEQDMTFTCCKSNHVKNLREQMQLWGAVTLFILTVIVLYIYYRRDASSDPICGTSRQSDEEEDERNTIVSKSSHAPYQVTDRQPLNTNNLYKM